ncbi:hypothetical protein Aduo_008769 [Ancylostoma duodenale]
MTGGDTPGGKNVVGVGFHFTTAHDDHLLRHIRATLHEGASTSAGTLAGFAERKVREEPDTLENKSTDTSTPLMMQIRRVLIRLRGFEDNVLDYGFGDDWISLKNAKENYVFSW